MNQGLTTHAPALFAIMSGHCWGWNLFDFTFANRPFLVTNDNDILAYPCVLTDDVSEVLAQIDKDYDGPAQKRLLCFEGKPTDEQFVHLWQTTTRMKDVMVCWVDIATSIKWQRQMTAVIDEHYPGGVRQGLIEHFGEDIVR